MKNLKKKEKSLPVSKGCEVEVSPRDERFQGSWFRAILEQAPAKVKGEKLRFRYKTLINEGGANPCREYIERCFIRPVPPECLNQGVKFKEGSVVDAYYSYGWWHGVIVVEEEDGNFLVYFDDPPDILKFDKNQMRPHAHWTGFKWVTRKNKELSKGMFSTGKLVEVTRKIDEREDIWVQSFVLKEIQGGDKREFFVKRCTSSQHLNDDAEEITTTVDIFNMRPSPPRDLFAKYELQDIVEVFVGYGWCKGEVKEILLDDQYKVSFKDTEERTIFKNHNIRRLMKWEDGVSIHAHMTEFEKEADTNVATPAITPQVSNISTSYVLEINDDDMMSDAPTEITIPQETANNTHDMDDGTTKDVEPPNITPRDFCQETLIGETMSNSDDAIVLPKRVFEPGAEKGLRRTRKEKGSGDEQEEQEEISGTKKKKKDPWMKKNQTVKSLLDLLVKDSKKLTADQRLRLGATILVEGILTANNPVTTIPEDNLLRARDFEEFCRYPWGILAYDALCVEVKKITTVVLERGQYGIPGFIYAIQLWALSSVDKLGAFFGDENGENQFPLCLHWIRTKSPTMEEVTKIDSHKKVVVKCILGDPELHSNLVEEVNTQFASVVDLVQRRYHVKRGDWRNGKIKIPIAEAEVEKNNYGPGIDATDKDKIEFLTKKIATLKERVEYLENLLKILQEQSQNEYQQVEDDAEVDNGDKDRETSKSNEGRTHDGEEQREEGDAEVDKTVQVQRQKRERGKKEDDAEVSDSDKGMSTSKINESQTHKEKEQQEESDAEVEKPVEGEKKKQGRERGKKLSSYILKEKLFCHMSLIQSFSDKFS
ncbi:hypothetical protein Bca4012_025877 [Brassica carinata]